MEKEHLGMILEDISGKFDLILEGHAALDRKLEARFDQLNENIEDNSFKIDILNKKSIMLPKTCQLIAAIRKCIGVIRYVKIKIGIMSPDSGTKPVTTANLSQLIQ